VQLAWQISAYRPAAGKLKPLRSLRLARFGAPPVAAALSPIVGKLASSFSLGVR
jgi:hypothetical protein